MRLLSCEPKQVGTVHRQREMNEARGAGRNADDREIPRFLEDITMSTLKRTRSILSVLAAVGLALGASTALQAQERQPTSAEEAQLGQDKVQEALTHPDQQLRELQNLSGLSQEQVTIVELSQIVPDEATVEQWRQENGTAITQFQTELQNHEAVKQALEADGRAVEDVFAVYVPKSYMARDEMTHDQPAEEQPSEEQPDQARDPSTRPGAGTVYVIVSGWPAGGPAPSDSI